VAGSATQAIAKSDKSERSRGDKGSERPAKSRAHVAAARDLKNPNTLCAKGRGSRNVRGESNVGRITLYNIAVGAVQSAEDSVMRASALLGSGESPSRSETSEDLTARVSRLRDLERSRGMTAEEVQALALLERQLAYVKAVEDLAAKKEAEAEAKLYASRGRKLSAETLAVLREGC
jgi:hypothetical protein